MGNSKRNILGKEFDSQVIEINTKIDNKQDKQDNTLTTSDKHVVGGINELKTRVDNLSSIGRYLSGWNAATGKPQTEPPTELPYLYNSGDYYIVSNIATGEGAVNYQPFGDRYDGNPSTTPIDSVKVGDRFFYNGTEWSLLAGGDTAPVLDVQVDGVTVVSDKVANITLSTKLDKNSEITTNSQVYVKNADGTQNLLDIGTNSGNIASYDSDNCIVSGTPTQDNQATPKSYVDDLVEGKQDALPEGLNDQILHKNAATGEIEWITVEFPYSAPTISQFVLLKDGATINASYEYGTAIVINSFKHAETNINNIMGMLSLTGGVETQTEIAKSATSATVDLDAPITLDGTTGKTLTLIGSNTKAAQFSKGASVSFVDFDYVQGNGTATVPTTATGLNKVSKGQQTTITYEPNKYIRFISQKTTGTIQQNILGQWVDIDTVNEGTVEFTQANGFVRTFHSYSTGPFMSGGSETFRLN